MARVSCNSHCPIITSVPSIPSDWLVKVDGYICKRSFVRICSNRLMPNENNGISLSLLSGGGANVLTSPKPSMGSYAWDWTLLSRLRYGSILRVLPYLDQLKPWVWEGFMRTGTYLQRQCEDHQLFYLLASQDLVSCLWTMWMLWDTGAILFYFLVL